MKKKFFCFILIQSIFAANFAFGEAKSVASIARKQASLESSRWGVSWMLGLASENEKSSQQELNSVGLLAGLKVQQKWNSYLGFNAEVAADLKSGQKDSMEGTKPAESALKLYEAQVEIGPDEGIKADIGALDSQAYHSSLLFARKAFPGVRPQWTYVTDGQEFKVFAETLAPQSHEVRSATGEKDKFPVFFAGGVAQDFKWSSRFHSQWKAGAFQFQSLNTSVQNTSIFLGNSSRPGPTSDLALLKYNFAGFEVSQDHKFLIHPKFMGDLQGDFLMNTAAPNGTNTAYRGQAGVTSVIMPKYHLVTEVEGFHIEPDAVLGAYSNTNYFNANRNGYRLGAGLIMKNENLKITASWIESQTIYINPPQTKEQVLFLSLETIYEKL